MRKLLLLAIAMFIAPVVALAGTVTQGNLRVVKILAGYTGVSGGEVYFLVDANPANPASCASTSSSYHVFAASPEYNNVDRILSLLLIAKATDGEIEVQVYDDKCLGTTALVRRVAI